MAFAQNAPAPIRRQLVLPASGEASAPLLANYLLKLKVADKDQPVFELSLVVATEQFSTNTVEPSLTFAGTIEPLADEAILVRYTLGIESALQVPGGPPGLQYRTANVQASVRLHPGESIQIFKSGTRTYELSVELLAAEGKKTD